MNPNFDAELCRNGTLVYTERAAALALYKALSLISNNYKYRKRSLHWGLYIYCGA